MARTKIVLAGEGGQGVQSIAKILVEAGYEAGKEILYIPNFGVEQRGGVSIAFCQIADERIGEPRYSKGDIIIMLSDRAGIVPGDGDTHQGIFDLSMLTPLPNLTIGAPSNYEELLDLINVAINGNGPFYIRYPKTNIDNPSNLDLDKLLNRDNTNNIQNMTYKWKVLNDLSDINILSLVI